MHYRQLHKFIILTIIVPQKHDSVICLENALGDIAALAPVPEFPSIYQ